MPIGIIVETLMRRLFKAVLKFSCYWTARLLVPVLSFGKAHVESQESIWIHQPSWHGFHRHSNGKILLEEKTGIFLGALFWFAVPGLYLLASNP